MTLRLNGSTSGYVEIDAPATAGSNTLVLPTGNGTNGQYLQTNGSGALSWATVTEYQGPSFAAQLSTHQSISQSTWTKVQFNTEVFDTDNCYDNTTNYRFTPTKAGYYQVNGQVYLDYTTTASSAVNAAIAKNGTRVVFSDFAGSTMYGVRNLSQVLYMNGSTDYLEIFGWTNGGSPRFYEDSVGHNYFSATWVHS